MGGDTVRKTELELSILSHGRIVVEYFDQSFIESEIQRLSRNDAEKLVYAEIHEFVTGNEQGRKDSSQITIFDSVGVALEDYAALRLTYELSEKYKIGEEGNFTPVIDDPKNLMKMQI